MGLIEYEYQCLDFEPIPCAKTKFMSSKPGFTGISKIRAFGMSKLNHASPTLTVRSSDHMVPISGNFISSSLVQRM